MGKYYSILIICMLSVCGFAANAQKRPEAQNPAIDNYKLAFTREAGGEIFNMHVDCSFTANRDSLLLNFGGNGHLSISDLTIVADNMKSYTMDVENKKLLIVLNESNGTVVELSYDYVNIVSAIVYMDYGIEIWETSHGEFYYPFVFGDKCNFSLTFDMPESLSVKGTYVLQCAGADEKQTDTNGERIFAGNKCVYNTSSPVISHSCNFALLDNDKYVHDNFTDGKYTVEAFYKEGACAIPASRKSELASLTQASIDFFSSIFEPYENAANQVVEKPFYIFHGNGTTNRNNLNFISVSLDKFCTKPNILPIVHEVGHRWIGEWTLLIEDGQPGAFFINESINEYMTLLFARRYYGKEYFEKLFKEHYLSKYDEIKGTKNDRHLIDMVRNDNWDVVYYKGPIIIHKIVEEWGEENWLEFIGDFYNRYKYVPHLTYDMFLAVMAEKSSEYAAKLDRLVRED